MPEPYRGTRTKLLWIVGGAATVMIVITAAAIMNSSDAKPQAMAPIVDGPRATVAQQIDTTDIFADPAPNAAAAAAPAATPDPATESASPASASAALGATQSPATQTAAAPAPQPTVAPAPSGLPPASFLFGDWSIQAGQPDGCSEKLNFTATTASNVAAGVSHTARANYAPNPKWINVFYDGGLTTYHQYNIVDNDDIAYTHCTAYACSTCGYHRG